MWSRVFRLSEAEVPPAAVLAAVEAAGVRAAGHFRGDDLGWTAARLELPGAEESPVTLDRYLAGEDDIRDELMAWAAFLETMDFSPHHGTLMTHVSQTRQLVTLRRPIDHSDEAALDRACEAALVALAAGDGVIQIDGRGWFDSALSLLLHEY